MLYFYNMSNVKLIAQIIKQQLNARGVQVSGTGLVKEDYVNMLIRQIKIDNKIKQNSVLSKAFKGMKTKKIILLS